MGEQAGATRPWWQHGVVYQVYPRSFRDVSGDGVVLASTHLDREGPARGQSIPLRATEGCVIRLR